MSLLIRPLRRLIAALDAACTRLYGWRRNPMHQSGTIAVAMLLVLLATGLYLVFVYRVGAPAESVQRIAADPWLGRWMRSLHRYATDLFVVAAVIHAARMLVQQRSWGPRTLAWISGLALVAIGLICAWTGYVMAWDSFGERLAREGGRLLDVLPIFSEPLSRIFAGDGPVPSAFFFVNLFLHIALPLAMGAGLWLHVSRLARPTLLPPKALLWGVIGALTVASLAFPATLGPAADPFRLAASTPTDLFVAWWMPLTERMAPGAVWLAVVGLTLLPLLVPRFTRRTREGTWATSVVDPRHCTGCNQCPQDCPWEAITMVPRQDDRPTLIAQIDPTRCVSCGICAGSCAPMGVGPPGHTGRDQLAALRATALEEVAAGHSGKPVAICCAQSPEAHRAALHAAGARLHLVSCVGNLHTSVIELLIRGGAPGVLVASCPPRDCIGREGPKWLHERLFNDREAELQPRVDRRRLRTTTLAPGDLASAMTAYREFVSELDQLERPQPEPDADLEAICEPIPLEEANL
jgi:ferredoxin